MSVYGRFYLACDLLLGSAVIAFEKEHEVKHENQRYQLTGFTRSDALKRDLTQHWKWCWPQLLKEKSTIVEGHAKRGCHTSRQLG